MDIPEYLTVGVGLVALGAGILTNHPAYVWAGAVAMTLGFTSLMISESIFPKKKNSSSQTQ